MTSSNIFLTGATGLIGRSLCRRLTECGAHVIALVRNIEKARSVLPREVTLVEGDMEKPWRYDGSVDFIVHMAGITDSQSFVERPVEVINGTLSGARNVLDFALQKKISKFLFLSTMEVYGLTQSTDVTETDFTGIDPTVPRSCYPEAKRLAECLFACAHSEYGLPTVIARLTQTFGQGVDANDKRVFAQFAAAARAGQDIVLQSGGETARCYCSLNDAISAIMILLEKGAPGSVYNIANPETFCTIREMAELVINHFAGGKCKIVVKKPEGVVKTPYLPTFRMRLNVDKLKELGWQPHDDLISMFAEII